VSTAGRAPEKMRAMNRAEELANQFEQVYIEFAELASSLSPEEWQMVAANSPVFRMGADETRTVGVVVHHVAAAMPVIGETVRKLAAGEELTPTQPADVDRRNQIHAAANPAPDQPRTVALVREHGSQAASLVRSLTDDALARSGRTVIGPCSAEDYVRRVLIGHVDWHRDSLKATVRR